MVYRNDPNTLILIKKILNLRKISWLAATLPIKNFRSLLGKRLRILRQKPLNWKPF